MIFRKRQTRNEIIDQRSSIRINDQLVCSEEKERTYRTIENQRTNH